MMILDLEQILKTNWQSWFGSTTPGHFDFMKIVDEAARDEEVIFLVFAENDRSPRVLARLSRSNPQTNVLRQQSGQEKTHPQVPRALWFGPSANGWTVYISTH